MKGWYGMDCWNDLSDEQQERLVKVGNLAFPWVPLAEGRCGRPPTVAIECEDDEAPGPRFMCLPCAVEYLHGKLGEM